MDFGILANLFDPTVLFFFFGILAVLIRSDLEIPPQLAKGFSLYLLLAIGYKGGVSLAHSGVSIDMLLAITIAMVMSFLVPIWSYFILRKSQPRHTAAAIAATYGSVSAVTFIAATNYLSNHAVEYGGYMIAALAMMESPAIIMAIFLANRTKPEGAKETSQMVVLREAFTDGNHILLLGSMIIGVFAGLQFHGHFPMENFITGDMFKGILAFFLLEMGLRVGREIKNMTEKFSLSLIGFALIMPVVHAAIATSAAIAVGLSVGDVFLLGVLAASASYIVVPAVLKYALPEAPAAKYFTMSIAMTFPFNLIVGLPLYYNWVQWAI